MATRFERSARRLFIGLLFVLVWWPGSDAPCKSFRFMAGPDVTSTSAGGNQGGAAGSSKSLYSMSPSAFFNTKQAQRRIDMNAVNRNLLSVSIFQATNLQRAKQGLKPLEHLPQLEEAAVMHAESMAKGRYLSHTNPNDPERRAPLDRVRSVGLDPKFVAENVATHFGIKYASGTRVYPVRRNGETEFLYSPGGEPIPNHTYRSFAETLLEEWMGSPEHRKNILASEAEYLGAGCAYAEAQDENSMGRFYCVQLFYTPMGT